MARKRVTPPRRQNPSSKNHAKQSITKDVKAFEADAKLILKHNREIIRKQGKSIRAFRHEFSTLRKLGVISKRKTATKAEPTKYYRSRLRKFADVLRGEAVPVRAPNVVRRKYADKGLYEERGGFLIIPKEHEKAKAKIAKGQVEITRPIGRRMMREIVLPYNATDMLDLANRMERDKNLPEIPGADMYMFSMYGHNSRQQGFPDKEELVKYIKVNYQHLFNSQYGPSAVKHFKLVIWGGHTSGAIPDVSSEKFYSGYKSGRRKRVNATGRNDGSWYSNRQYETAAAQQKKRRAKMTPQEKALYQARARQRARDSYQRRKKDAKDNGF
jgi:hypothetical protein